MRILALSGSLRTDSSNTFLLQSIADMAKPVFECEITTCIGTLPIFSPDLEGSRTPAVICEFAAAVAASQGILISSPEYVRAIPGGLKNAIDWLVSRDEIISKPIALVHASHRGDDMLDSLRAVLATVSDNFSDTCFLRIPLASQPVEQMHRTIRQMENEVAIREFVRNYKKFVMSSQ